MVQVRIMSSDEGLVRKVAKLLLPAIEASPDLHVGEPREASTRGPGLRIFLEVIPAQPSTDPIRVHADRADRQPAPARRPVTRPRALPPARDT